MPSKNDQPEQNDREAAVESGKGNSNAFRETLLQADWDERRARRWKRRMNLPDHTWYPRRDR